MKTLLINGQVVKVYDSIDEMPIVNFQKYNKFLLIDSGIGSDVDSIDSHIVKIAKSIKLNDNKKAMQELQNMRQNLYMINNELSPKYLAFTALIYSINGRRLTDLSDDSLKHVLAELNKVRHSCIIDFMAKFKKKVESELDTYFPNTFISAKEKTAYDKIKRRTLLVLDSILDGIDRSDDIESIDTELFMQYKPKNFLGSDSIEVQYDKQFETTCILVKQKTGLRASEMTVLQFYNAIEDIKKRAELEAKQLKRNSHGR